VFEVEYVLPRRFSRGGIATHRVEAHTAAQARRAVEELYRRVLILRVNLVAGA
jgi:hypothetical protein